MTTTPEKPRSNRTLLIWSAAGLAVVAVVGGLFVFTGRSKPPYDPKTPATSSSATVSDSLETVRHAVLSSLTKGSDFVACRTLLEQLNGDLGRLTILKEKADQGGAAGNQKHKNLVLPTPLPADQRDWLKANLLDADEVAEIEGPRYTRLDSHYLDACLLFRDAAHSLDVDSRPALERATAGFNWVMRQVRLGPQGEAVLPPAFVVRRGWSSNSERAIAVLACLRQLDCDTCIVEYGKKGNDRERYILCGVLVEEAGKKQIYLFDPALGLPLPGPDGKGVATLESVRKQDHLLAAIPVPEAYRYDPKPTHLYLFCNLSGLAPRAKYLQESILAPDLYVNLYEDAPGLQKRFADALQELGEKDLKAEFHRESPGLALRFLPPEEGGVAKPYSFPYSRLPGFASTRLERGNSPIATLPLWVFYDYAQAPWHLFPEPLRDLEVTGEAGRQTRAVFAGFFRTLSVPPRVAQKREQRGDKEPDANDVFLLHGKKTADESYLASKLVPLDEMLRGQYDLALPQLVHWCDQLANQKASYESNPLIAQNVTAWAKKANDAYVALLRALNMGNKADVDQARAELTRILNNGQQGWLVQLDGITAGLRAEEATYLAALCLQEQAVRHQLRLDQADSQATDADRQQARHDWEQANNWWVRFLGEYPNSDRAPTARLRHAEVLHQLGQDAQAVQKLQDTSGPLSDLDKAARSYLAGQLKK